MSITFPNKIKNIGNNFCLCLIAVPELLTPTPKTNIAPIIIKNNTIAKDLLTLNIFLYFRNIYITAIYRIESKKNVKISKNPRQFQGTGDIRKYRLFKGL